LAKSPIRFWVACDSFSEALKESDQKWKDTTIKEPLAPTDVKVDWGSFFAHDTSA